MRHWTKSELLYLQKLAMHYSPAKIASRMERPIEDVMQMLEKLKGLAQETPEEQKMEEQKQNPVTPDIAKALEEANGTLDGVGVAFTELAYFYQQTGNALQNFAVMLEQRLSPQMVASRIDDLMVTTGAQSLLIAKELDKDFIVLPRIKVKIQTDNATPEQNN